MTYPLNWLHRSDKTVNCYPRQIRMFGWWCNILHSKISPLTFLVADQVNKKYWFFLKLDHLSAIAFCSSSVDWIRLLDGRSILGRCSFTDQQQSTVIFHWTTVGVWRNRCDWFSLSRNHGNWLQQTSQSATHRFAFESNKRIRADAAVVEHRAHLPALFISVANGAITPSGVVVADIDGKSVTSAIKAPSDEAGGTDFDH